MPRYVVDFCQRERTTGRRDDGTTGFAGEIIDLHEYVNLKMASDDFDFKAKRTSKNVSAKLKTRVSC